MNAEKEITRERTVPEEKIELVKELTEKIKKYRTVLIASSKGLPGQQFHEIKKKLRDKAEIKVVKNRIISRAIDQIERGYIKNLKKELGPDIVIFFSELDPFDLAGLLDDNQSPSKARAGDIAPDYIEIEPGPTELMPGPAISELSGVGLKVAVKEGKLEIMKGAIVTKKGEIINANVANVLTKLNIKPMKVGFVPLAAYDSKEDKIYIGIKIDKEGTLEELKELIKKALGFAVNVEYLTDKTISYFIAKAASEEKILGNLIEVEKKEITKEKKDEKEEIKEKLKEDLNKDDKQEEDLNNKDKTEK
ncbi:MAG: 50S ribosomal protein L10 [Nanoarchaeota archaeon]|nr:50S ribosomal protein L10 [Nanoarchaeota archaeon]